MDLQIAARNMLLVHPETHEALLRRFQDQEFAHSAALPFDGTPLFTSFACPKKYVRWEFPQERFVTYEPGDAPWCRYFGIGHEVECHTVYEIKESLLQSWAFTDEPSRPPAGPRS